MFGSDAGAEYLAVGCRIVYSRSHQLAAINRFSRSNRIFEKYSKRTDLMYDKTQKHPGCHGSSQIKKTTMF